jgi:hypothetical protein
VATRRTNTLDLTDPGGRTRDAQDVWRALLLTRSGSGGMRSRVWPHDGMLAVADEGTQIIVQCTPPVRAEIARHLPVGAVVTAYPDPEVPPAPVRLLKPSRVVPVRQWAVRVPTPDGEVRLWPDEFDVLLTATLSQQD